jgi:predicted alpha/beta superfamily hydrolase
MRQLLLFKVLIINCLIAQAQLSIKVTAIPVNTPANDNIHIAGNFNNWNEKDTSKILKKQNDGSYFLTLTPSVGTVEYKFTRGSWQTVEGNATGGFRPNRTFNYTGGAQTIDNQKLSWEGQGLNSTAAVNVRIVSSTFSIPQLNRTRRIWVYLPPNYNADTTKRYPVMYLQDGQNLFDKATSFSGEWEVDETLNNLAGKGDRGCIVVGIDNGGAARINEYSPWKNTRYGGGEGAFYAKFIVETLKPYIDKTFRTRPDRLNTAIGGSSMGGVIAAYTAAEYQQVFSKALIFSPAFWFSDSCYYHMAAMGKRFPMRYYLMAGQLEDNGTVVHDLYKMEKMFIGIGYQAKKDYIIVPHTDGQHAEWFWAREFGAGYQWLFAENASPTEGVANGITKSTSPPTQPTAF